MASTDRSSASGAASPVRVQVVVPVHRTDRPVERALASVLDAEDAAVEAIVVCHGIAADGVRGRIPAELRPRVRLIEHSDGIPSPSGPFNAGLDEVTAPYVALLASDDWLAPGALRSWLVEAGRWSADVVLARMETSQGVLNRTPPARPRRHLLDPVRDRLAYRSAAPGLMRTAFVNGLGLRFPAGLTTGEDLEFTTRLWNSGGRLVLARREPPYVVADDGGERISLIPRPAATELAGVQRMLEASWFTGLSPAAREALVVKLLRVQVFGAVAGRLAAGTWDDEEAAVLRTLTEQLVATAPGAPRVLSLADDRLLRAVLGRGATVVGLQRMVARRARHGRWDTLLTRRPLALLDRNAPLRTYAAAALWR